ncbi:MAG TPA: bifunctional riboflavin kinase/FAD synthetase [Candidatus Pelagibacter bacterium]|jgi:riboflavin kinase/FMN adenylyltransferase|nr:bifunctional riboflavin kinase/FAD synthetase [Candidatus Pelagibacter bacterium]|tara:strand:- start:16453 stop:17388 length:936 start_codon:yes stop_codon:yes gene_type:complete
MVKKIKFYNNFKISNIHKNSILLVGNFDGLHIGHQKLFNLAKKYKKNFKLKIGLVTFEPIPKMYFNSKLTNFRISSISQKIKILEKFGLDFLITKKFDKKFSNMKSHSFIKEVLYKKLNAKYIFVSNNFRFGNKREGNVNQLINNEKNYNYKIIKPQPLKLKNKIISSTLIRKLLSNGKIEFVNKLLNRNWSIDGKVEKGRQLGKKIGFPTCNIDIKDYVLAKPGVYAVKIYRKNKNFSLKGIANLGYRPTFNQKKILLEVHIFNFHENLYNKYLTIEFINFIRKEKKFKNINQLKKQINLDLKIAKKKLK